MIDKKNFIWFTNKRSKFPSKQLENLKRMLFNCFYLFANGDFPLSPSYRSSVQLNFWMVMFIGNNKSVKRFIFFSFDFTVYPLFGFIKHQLQWNQSFCSKYLLSSSTSRFYYNHFVTIKNCTKNWFLVNSKL